MSLTFQSLHFVTYRMRMWRISLYFLKFDRILKEILEAVCLDNALSVMRPGITNKCVCREFSGNNKFIFYKFLEPLPLKNTFSLKIAEPEEMFVLQFAEIQERKLTFYPIYLFVCD